MTELLKKHKGASIPQENQNLNAKENRDDVLEKSNKNKEIEGTKARTSDKSQLDAIKKIQKEQLDDDFKIKDVSPLSPKILVETCLPKFKLPSLESMIGRQILVTILTIFIQSCSTRMLVA